jgi:hypothetical protein
MRSLITVICIFTCRVPHSSPVLAWVGQFKSS